MNKVEVSRAELSGHRSVPRSVVENAKQGASCRAGEPPPYCGYVGEGPLLGGFVPKTHFAKLPYVRQQPLSELHLRRMNRTPSLI